MIPIKPFLKDIDGILHIADPDYCYNKPEIYINHWSTGIKTADFIREYGPIENIPIEPTRQYSGRYCFKRHYLEPYRYIDLINGPKTESVKTEFIPVPCPKVRQGIKTRWSESRHQWEKELKTGWCPA